MKRLFVVATMAIMAVGCQKTTVENEVLTPIGFNTEVGKQTRAIIEGTTFTGDFGVYAFGHQGDAAASTVMTNVKVNAAGVTEGTYYWPNDASTTLNFYAYAPYNEVTVNVDDANKSIAMDTYTHTDRYLDFMVATPVIKAKFSDQNGEADGTVTDAVPVIFKHQFTQVVFVVKSTVADGIAVKLNSIKLLGINNSAKYSSVAADVWSNEAGAGEYTIFPVDTQVAGTVIPAATGITSTAVTMIPQALTASTQKFYVEYEISGTGVATETVKKTIDLTTTEVPEWKPNMKVVYNLSVGLQPIVFKPSVVGWDDATNVSANIN